MDSAEHSLYLALDIGSAKLAAGVVDDGGRVLVRDRVPTPPREVWPALERLVRRVIAAAPGELTGVGVGCSGPIDTVAGTVVPLHIPSLIDFPLNEAVRELTGLATTVDTDAKAFTLAEAWCGAGRGEMDMAGVVIGRGVGSGLISRGKLLSGRRGNAGGIGHIVVEPEGRPCACGGLGCLDAYVSGASIETETSRPPQRAPLGVIDRTGLLVGRALVTLTAMVDIRVVVIGGSVALGFGEPFFNAAQEELDSRAKMSHVQGVQIRRAQLGELSTMIGAAALARRHALGVA
jgi:glucokinase